MRPKEKWMKVREWWNVGFMVVATVALTTGVVGCGGGGSSSTPVATTATETAGVAGSWGGTWNEGGVESHFDVTIDCSGGLTGTLTPSGGGNAEPVTEGTVTSWTWDETKSEGTISANFTIGGETRQLVGIVLRSRDSTGNLELEMTGSATLDSRQTASIVLQISGNLLICNASQIADLSSGSSVTSGLTPTVDPATTTCTGGGTGAVPYGGTVNPASTTSPTDKVAILLQPRTLSDGTQVVDVIMTFAPTDASPQVGVIGTSASTGSELQFSGIGTTSGTDYEANLDVSLAIGADGTLSGTFTGNVDADGNGNFDDANDCSAISGTLSGDALVP